jgi:hypothetical protein
VSGGDRPKRPGPDGPLKCRRPERSIVSTTTLCQVCESATAQRTCSLCGAAVCADHFAANVDCCVDCAPADDGPAGH